MATASAWLMLGPWGGVPCLPLGTTLKGRLEPGAAPRTHRSLCSLGIPAWLLSHFPGNARRVSVHVGGPFRGPWSRAPWNPVGRTPPPRHGRCHRCERHAGRGLRAPHPLPPRPPTPTPFSVAPPARTSIHHEQKTSLHSAAAVFLWATQMKEGERQLFFFFFLVNTWSIFSLVTFFESLWMH